MTIDLDGRSKYSGRSFRPEIEAMRVQTPAVTTRILKTAPRRNSRLKPLRWRGVRICARMGLGKAERERSMEVRIATLDEILPLRQDVLIEGTDRESPYFAGDFDTSTRHLGVFLEGRCIGCATLVRSEYDDAPAWQLRGMATVPELQHRGIGRMLLKYAEDEIIRTSAIPLAWCNARVQAVPFYRKMGWNAVSDSYVIEGVGPHRKMMRSLD